jgi:ribonuclease HI
VPISYAELKAIEIATNFIFQQDEQRAVILTDSRTACQILKKAMKGDRHNEIALRILKNIPNSQKQMTIKWIPAHFGLEGNERADILAKDGVRNGTPIEYSQKIKDAYRILKETQREEWNNRYVLKVAPKIEPDPWYENTKLSSVDTHTHQTGWQK